MTAREYAAGDRICVGRTFVVETRNKVWRIVLASLALLGLSALMAIIIIHDKTCPEWCRCRAHKEMGR